MSVFPRLRGNITTLRGALRALRRTMPILKHPDRVFCDVIEDAGRRYGDAVALLSERERFTYRELAARANQYARWALAQGLGKGDTVCLLMPNRPEYIAVWLGITRVGGVVALLNTHLSGASLAHCVNIVRPKCIIAGAELLEGLASARPQLATNAPVWVHGESVENLPRIDLAADAMPSQSIPRGELPQLTIEDRALLIYTSGTTGMPKAANVNHFRVMLVTHGFAGVMDTRSSDRMYDCLPMYHTAGGLLAPGAVLVSGGSVVIREKFSARDFWADIVRWECTLFQYIGELCRYLVNSPLQPDESGHRVRLCCGNGLRPDVWRTFKERFRIPQILEFYAATEGNCTLFNFEGKEGAVGRLPGFLARRFPIKIVRTDLVTGEPARDAQGFCVECELNEPGEVIGKIINDPTRPGNRFEGYSEESETERKILRDAFAPGDAWFRTGDLMRKDEEGFFYFVDRIGDTFRWKGENVATCEVAAAIAGCPGVLEANVYGVDVPGHEGKAGMAALVAEPTLDLSALRAHVHSALPQYARPLFLRFVDQIDATSTFKQKKLDLVRDGFDPERVDGDLFFDHPEAGTFVPLDRTLHERLLAREIRL